MSFRITGLSPDPFRHLYGLSDAELAAHGATRVVADRSPGFPDRIEVRDAEPGEALLLLNFVHQPADTAYRASHAIFVREGAEVPFDAVGAVPEVIRRRPISLRGFDRDGTMVDAALVDGGEVAVTIEAMFGDPAITYLHAHYAVRGCYAARIDRA
jgi:hypothetical protein